MKLPAVHIVARGDAEVTLTFAVPAGSEAFAGHFPGQPILPGVVQIDWAVRLAARYLGVDKPAGSDMRIKFRRVVKPDTAVTLLLRLDRAKNRLIFSYRDGEVETTTGQIGLGGAA